MRTVLHTLPFLAQVIGANALLWGARAWYGLRGAA